MRAYDSLAVGVIVAVAFCGCASSSRTADQPVNVARSDTLDKGGIVNVDNFIRAETDNYFAKFVKDAGIGKFHHDRELADIDKQTVIRMNRDTLYSFAVFDLDASPVTIKLPDAGKRFISVLIIDEDQYAPDVFYTSGPHVLTKEEIGTRYVCAAVRTFVNPNDPDDIRAVHALQDAITATQKNVGKFETPTWDQTSLKRIRDALLALNMANGPMDSSRMFGRKHQVDEVQHLLGTAAGWGGNPRADAMYAGGEVKNNDGKTPYTLTVKDVPVDGFWSISVYNKAGFFEKNPQNAYSLNNVTAKPGPDGSVTIHFGGEPTADNYLATPPGWNYAVRMYRPRKEILDGSWKFPEPQPVK